MTEQRSLEVDGSAREARRRDRRPRRLVGFVALALLSYPITAELVTRLEDPADVASHAAALYPPAPRDGPMRILLLGDSITQGGRGDPGTPVAESYRYALFQGLVDHGVRFDFVGSMHAPFEVEATPPPHRGIPFDPDHEGHWGWTSRSVRERLGDWLAGYEVDVALVLLGTNDPLDAMSVGETLDELEAIVDLLRRENPRVVVLLGQVFHAGFHFRLLRFRVERLARALHTASSPVVVVHLEDDWESAPDAPDADTIDWIHPNPKGDRKIAARFLEALLPFAPRFDDSLLANTH